MNDNSYPVANILDTKQSNKERIFLSFQTTISKVLAKKSFGKKVALYLCVCVCVCDVCVWVVWGGVCVMCVCVVLFIYYFVLTDHILVE